MHACILRKRSLQGARAEGSLGGAVQGAPSPDRALHEACDVPPGLAGRARITLAHRCRV